MATAYYNEWERFPAEWLCNLMTAGRITNGRVDQRSIKDVSGPDLVGFDRVHLFAGCRIEVAHALESTQV